MREPLTREKVISAAVGLADEAGVAGVAAVTMRKLAERLGVEAMSLYHHVANKERILDGMIGAVFQEIELPVVGDPWRPAMRQRAVSLRDVLLRHPWAVGLMDSRVDPEPAILHHHDRVIGTLRAAGFSLAMARHAFSVLDSYIYGFVLQEVSLPFDSSEPMDAMAGDMLGRLPDGAYPYLVELTVGHVMQPGYAYADEFRFGLELILDGLERSAQTGDDGPRDR